MSVVAKAKRLLELHHEPAVLLLPNVWDPLGARLLQSLGFPAVATASAAIAYSRGVDDGQDLPFETMLEAIRSIAQAVDVPVTADIEAGYADDPDELADNIKRVVAAGVAGVNIEDSLTEGGELRSLRQQVRRIERIREAAGNTPLVINARIDIYLRDDETTDEQRWEELLERATAYREAGADCLYPITLESLSALRALRDQVGLPLNVFGHPGCPSPDDLGQAGVSRVSLGPGWLRAALAALRDSAISLRDKGSYAAFGEPSTDQIRAILGLAEPK